MNVAADFLDLFDPGSRHGHKGVIDPKERLANDVHTRLGQNMVHIGDAPGECVVNRDNGQFNIAVFQCTKGAFKGPVGYGGCTRKGTPGSLIGIGPVHSLKSDPLLRSHLVVS